MKQLWSESLLPTLVLHQIYKVFTKYASAVLLNAAVLLIALPWILPVKTVSTRHGLAAYLSKMFLGEANGSCKIYLHNNSQPRLDHTRQILPGFVCTRFEEYEIRASPGSWIRQVVDLWEDCWCWYNVYSTKCANFNAARPTRQRLFAY